MGPLRSSDIVQVVAPKLRDISFHALSSQAR